MTRIAATILALSCLASQARAQQPRTVAVLGLAAKGVSTDLAANVADIVATELGNMPELKVVTVEEINAILGVEKMKDSLGCTDSMCLAEIGGALGTDLVMQGSVGQLGDVYTITLALVDINKAETLARASEQAKSANDLPAAARRAVATLTGRQPAAAAAAARPAGKGGLFVQSSPEGADVYLDGKKSTGKTPLTLDEVPAGDHTIKVALGELAREIPVLVKADKITKYEVNLQVVRAKFTSVPFDAEVFVGGEPRGTTPLLLPELGAGTYEVEFKKKGYAPQKLSVLFDFDEYKRSGQAQTVEAKLEVQPVPVQVATTPQGATVRLAEKEVGQTPVTVADLLPGTYPLEVQLGGYRPEKRELKLEPGEPVTLELPLAEYAAHAQWVETGELLDTLTLASLIGAGALGAGAAVLAALHFGSAGDADAAHASYLAAVDPAQVKSLREERDDLASSASTQGTLAVGLGAAAGAAALAAAAFYFLAPSEPEYGADSEVLSIVPSADGATVTARLSF